MARIRTVKPDFFRHEKLQDVEAANLGKFPMLVYEGLWSLCDNQGVFEWRPRIMKLDILPFLSFDMAETLEILASAGFVRKYEVSGKEYGVIDSFNEHQRLTGKEAGEDGRRFPAPPENAQGNNGETSGKQLGNNGERPVSQERKGKEEEKEGKGEPVFSLSTELNPGRKNAIARAELARSVWNEVQATPPAKKIFLAFSRDREPQILCTLSSYTDEEIAQAIRNYAKAFHTPGVTPFPTYGTIDGFLATGVEQYTDEAKPFDRCRDKAKGPEKAGPLDDRPDSWDVGTARRLQEEAEKDRKTRGTVDLSGEFRRRIGGES